MSSSRIQDALSKLLDALGFKTMAIDVLEESDKERLRKYALVIVKNWPETPHEMNLLDRRGVADRLRYLGLI